ncbi:hypothetical protein CNEO4_540042 [Clostridium neonatale]|nr:hypothetical protein CNEO4_540042 [Clostridium neonatale]
MPLVGTQSAMRDEKLSEMKDKLKFERYNSPVGIVVCGNMNLAF